MKKLWIIPALFLTGILSACEGKGTIAAVAKAEETVYAASDEEDEEDAAAEIVIYITGEVNNPGVYKLKEGDRIYQAVDMAGGMTKEAADGAINLAEYLTDGMQITVTSQQEYEAQEEAKSEEESGLVNLNTASKEQLMTLPGIGEAKADLIISYRENQGSFASVEDIKNISGIKDGVYNRIKDYICVN
ncbi:MAG: helix-hairpin-helix domain-containing protein [Eubacterium sp.]|nr:helix-hairpin-helix domain-containing protein [Eubacterium sp.]